MLAPDKLAALRAVLEAEPAVRLAYLFGSVARGDDGPGSDIDVALWLGDEVDLLALGALGERRHRLEDPAVGLAVEVLAVEDLRRGVEGLVVHEDGPEDGPLRFRVVREGPLPRGGLGAHNGNSRAASRREVIPPW